MTLNFDSGTQTSFNLRILQVLMARELYELKDLLKLQHKFFYTFVPKGFVDEAFHLQIFDLIF